MADKKITLPVVSLAGEKVGDVKVSASVFGVTDANEQGILYYNKAIAIAEEASNEFNDAKYMKLVEQFEEQFTKAIDPFEKAFAICQDPDIKVNLIAESLKNIYYRFRDKGADYQAAYDKYSDIVKNGL